MLFNCQLMIKNAITIGYYVFFWNLSIYFFLCEKKCRKFSKCFIRLYINEQDMPVHLLNSLCEASAGGACEDRKLFIRFHREDCDVWSKPWRTAIFSRNRAYGRTKVAMGFLQGRTVPVAGCRYGMTESMNPGIVGASIIASGVASYRICVVLPDDADWQKQNPFGTNCVPKGDLGDVSQIERTICGGGGASARQDREG